MLKPKADNCENPIPPECCNLPQIYSFASSHNHSLLSVALRAKRNLRGKSLGAFQIELNDLPTLRQKLQQLADKKCWTSLVYSDTIMALEGIKMVYKWFVFVEL